MACRLDLLGPLAECYVFASDYTIAPWLAVTPDAPQWQPHAGEVESVVELPIESLLRQDAVGSLTIDRGPLVFHAPCFRVGEARIWGATSMILSEFAGVLRDCSNSFA